MNPFLTREGSERRFIRRLYARVDQLEVSTERKWWHLLLDSVDADFFDAAERDEQYFDRLPLRIIEWKTPPKRLFFQEAVPWRAFPEDTATAWLELTMTLTPTREVVRVYSGLAAEPEGQYVAGARTVDPVTAARLENEFSLDDQPDAATADLLGALGNSQGIDHVAVYDVGQGNCNALCHGAPRLYFDFGGGVLANRHTFPAGLSRWCLTSDPAVVLSHWDWDHWSSATLRFPQALSQTWIVPRQQLGAVHKTLAHSISTNGRLLVWPSKLAKLSSGQVTVFRCTGKGRNHSGLAITVADSVPSTLLILLTGDARYSAIPGAHRMSLGAVVIPHHGADMRSKRVPAPAGWCTNPRAVYSYGQGNSYGHPLQVTRQLHDGAGWRHAAISGPPDLVCETANRSAHGLGHVGLYWHYRPSLLLPCAGSACDLAIQQT